MLSHTTPIVSPTTRIVGTRVALVGFRVLAKVTLMRHSEAIGVPEGDARPFGTV